MPKKPFYFDGNQWTGFVDSEARWQALLKAYERVTSGPIEARATVLRANALREGESKQRRPAFGFYLEYTGKQTLGEWLESLSLDERVMEVI